MNRTIQAVTLNLTKGAQRVRLPKNHKVLKVGVLENQPCMWIMIDKSTPPIMKFYALKTTGEDLKAGEVYVGTLVANDIDLHIFELPPSSLGDPP
jgi:hypothetical protein